MFLLSSCINTGSSDIYRVPSLSYFYWVLIFVYPPSSSLQALSYKLEFFFYHLTHSRPLSYSIISSYSIAFEKKKANTTHATKQQNNNNNKQQQQTTANKKRRQFELRKKVIAWNRRKNQPYNVYSECWYNVLLIK